MENTRTNMIVKYEEAHNDYDAVHCFNDCRLATEIDKKIKIIIK
jgi:hypothetical protein